MTLRRPILLVALALSLTACASVPLKQRATLSVQSVEIGLGAIQDAERQLCDPVAAAVRPPVPIPRCQGPVAASIGLTTARHQAFARRLVTAFDLQLKTATALLAWRAGDPAPASLDELRTVLNEILNFIRELVAHKDVRSVTLQVQAVMNSIVDTMLLFRGGE